MSDFINKIWDTFSESEQRLLLCLFPFQHTINFAEPVIKEYLQELKEVGFKYLPLDQHRLIKQKCIDVGVLIKIEEFPNTAFLKFTPSFSLFLKKKAARFFNENELFKIETSFISFYDWLSQQLYDMYLYTPPEERQVNLEFIAYEYENLLAALKISIQHNQYNFTEIFLLLNTYLSATRRYSERLKLGKELLNKMESLQDIEKGIGFRFSLVNVYDSVGAAFISQVQYFNAVYYFQKALEKYHEFELEKEYPKAIRSLYQSLAATTGYLEQWDISNDYYFKMLQVAEEHQDEEGIADYHLNIGKNMLNLDRFSEAITRFEKAAHSFHHLKLKDWEGVAYKYLGITKLREKKMEEASKYSEKALEIFSTLNDQVRKAEVFNDMSLMYFGSKDYTNALQCAKKAIATFIQEGARRQEGVAYINFCSAAVGLGELKQCKDYLRKALLIFLEYKDIKHLRLTLHLAGLLDSYNKTNVLSEFIDVVLEVYSEEEVSEFLR